MSFLTEVESITGALTAAEKTNLNLYLPEGVRFITRALMVNGSIVHQFTASADVDHANGFDLDSVINITEVYRNDNDTTNSKWRECERIMNTRIHDIKDENSIYFTNKYDPKFYIKQKKLYVYPVPTVNEAAEIYHITCDSSVTHAQVSGDIDAFPKEYERGVILYSAIQCIRKKLHDIVEPTIQGATDLTGMESGDVTVAADRLQYDKWWDMVGDYLADEDVELANATLQQIASYLGAYQTELGSSGAQYQWHESQYIKLQQELLLWIGNYIPLELGGSHE